MTWADTPERRETRMRFAHRFLSRRGQTTIPAAEWDEYHDALAPDVRMRPADAPDGALMCVGHVLIRGD